MSFCISSFSPHWFQVLRAIYFLQDSDTQRAAQLALTLTDVPCLYASLLRFPIFCIWTACWMCAGTVEYGSLNYIIEAGMRFSYCLCSECTWNLGPVHLPSLPLTAHCIPNPAVRALWRTKSQYGHLAPSLCHPTFPPFSCLHALVSVLPPNLCLCYYIGLAFSCLVPLCSSLPHPPQECTLSLFVARAALPFFAVLIQVLLNHLKNIISTAVSSPGMELIWKALVEWRMVWPVTTISLCKWELLSFSRTLRLSWKPQDDNLVWSLWDAFYPRVIHWSPTLYWEDKNQVKMSLLWGPQICVWGESELQSHKEFKVVPGIANERSEGEGRSLLWPLVLLAWRVDGRDWLGQYGVRATTVGRIYPRLQPCWVCALVESS